MDWTVRLVQGSRSPVSSGWAALGCALLCCAVLCCPVLYTLKCVVVLHLEAGVQGCKLCILHCSPVEVAGIYLIRTACIA